MERVSVIRGKSPIIVVAPHGYEQDDQNTAFMAECIANEIDCYAVINRGWERCLDADVLNDKADCNNVFHCQEDVVREEFLEPIVRFKNRILVSHEDAFVIFIHGMSNRHRQVCKDPSLGAVVGYGAGSPMRSTCEPWMKNLILKQLNDSGIVAYEGKSGGPMSGWSKANMNQYFRMWEKDTDVNSLQIEVVYDLRKDRDTANVTAMYLAQAIGVLGRATGYTGPSNFKVY